MKTRGNVDDMFVVAIFNTLLMSSWSTDVLTMPEFPDIAKLLTCVVSECMLVCESLSAGGTHSLR